jgi:hypothetical protein
VADYTPIFSAGLKPRFFTAGGTIVGGNVVALSAANTVIASGAASLTAVGVAGHDAANGTQVTVWPLSGVTHEVVASATIAVGDNLATAAAGQVAPIAAGTFGQLIGVAVTAGAASAKIEMVGR